MLGAARGPSGARDSAPATSGDRSWDHGSVHRWRSRAAASIVACGAGFRAAGWTAGGWAAAGLVLAAIAAVPAAAHGAVPAAPPDAGTLLLGWSFEPVLVLPLLAAAAAWWRLLGAVDRTHPENPVPRLRRWAFLGGLLAIAVALQSGIERYDTTLFSVHMVQHLLLTLVAPPLLALAAPVTQLMRAVTPEARGRWILPVLRSRLLGVLSHPVVAWLVFVSVMWATHFSPLFDLSLEDPLIHDLEHGLYLGAALLFWWPVVSLDPAPHRMGYPGRLLYLFLQMPQNSFLAMAILFADAPLYPHYVTLGSPYGIGALADQRLAAGLMWFVGDVIFLVALLAVLGGWMRSEQRGAASADRRADAERDAIRERETALRDRKAAGGTGQPGTGEASSSR